MRALFAFILALLCASAAFAAPADVSRVLKTIDFEERRLGNQEDVPMHWQKVEGEGLPHYVNGKLSNDRARSGDWSFRFDLNGGSLIYRYDPGQNRVQTGAHYRAEAYVQTTVLPTARARITAYFTDVDGHPIADSMVHSELYAARHANEDWHRLTAELTADNKAAAYLVVELELLQQSVYAAKTLGDRSLFPQDIRGSAWFDDLTISQVPQMILSSNRPGNVFRKSDPLSLTVTISDRFTDDLADQLVIKDALGKEVYQRSGALDSATVEDLHPGKRMTISLPALKPGWYDAALVMTSHGQYVDQKDVHIVKLADDAPLLRPDPRFGVIATDLPFAGWSQLPQILPLLSVGRVKLAVWSSEGDVEQQDPIAFDALLEKFRLLGITPTACLTGIPPLLATQIGGSDWPRLLASKPEIWRPELAFMISRHANHLDRWQFGADADAAVFLEKPEMRSVYNLLYKEFAALVDEPDLAMPWPAWYDLSGTLPATVALSLPPEVLPWQLPMYMQDVRGHEGHNLSLSLQLLDDRYGREVRIRDLAQRVTYALAGGASRIDLPLPLEVRKDGNQFSDEPTELMLIMRTLVGELSGTTYRGRVPIADNIEAFLFDRNGKGVIVMWTRGGKDGAKQLALNLGDHSMRVDLWGNVSPLIQGEGKDKDKVQLDIGSMPIFLVDIDGAAAQMRASVGFDKPLLESSFEPHARKIHFTNPTKTTIAGSMKLTGPQGWTLTPAFFSFSLNPGETFDREVSIEFPYNSFAGAKTVMADFKVQADRDTAFNVPLTLSLGLSDVGMQSLALRDKNDLVVQQMITNYGDKPINYTAFAVYPGQPRQERLVTGLGAGRTTIKLYRFPNVEIIKNAKVRSGLKEVEGTRILNDEVGIQ